MCCDVTIKYHETSPLRVADQDYKKTKAIQFKILKTLKILKEKATNISLTWMN